ncbi:hypothetical protein, partial [Stutzerimonas balearica]|uniref:hypothetical protein n=1 Tax=Stutzerimonas balearica TaxID=74829 RepID=UPI0032B1A8F6
GLRSHGCGQREPYAQSPRPAAQPYETLCTKPHIARSMAAVLVASTGLRPGARRGTPVAGKAYLFRLFSA